MLELLRSDLRRKSTHYILNTGFVERYIKVPLQLGTLAVLAYRFSHWAGKTPLLLGLIVRPLACLLEFVSGSFTGIRIKSGTCVGPGFIIHNFSAIFVDAESIGSNFTVNQGVSVGRDGQGRPKIGNNVFLGSGAKVLGAVTIGDNVVVAANAYVNKSVPDNCTVAGVPARMISRGAGSQYLNLTDRDRNAVDGAAQPSVSPEQSGGRPGMTVPSAIGE